MDAAHIIEHHSVGTGYFVTLTMAGGTRKAYACMAAASGYIVDRLNRWLRYRVSDGLFCYVWELQERGAPHLHYVLRFPSDVPSDVFECDLRAQWRKILDDVSDQSGVDVFARDGGGTWRGNAKYPRIQCKPITHSYASYVAKYASKNRTKGGRSASFRPGRWWGVSYPARKRIKKLRLDVVFPVKKLERGLELARGIIETGGAVCTGFKWLELPPEVVLHSVSIFCAPGVARRVVKALVNFVATGDVHDFVCTLKALSQLWDKQNKQGEDYGLQ
jgi:hypothetical protein